VLSDDYYPTFLRDNVTLETRTISRITKKGILFQGQESETEFDLIVLATGFETFVRQRAGLSETRVLSDTYIRTTCIH
jgi:cation diffusion facilitator CzcD-associated flavoprotein CzcO